MATVNFVNLTRREREIIGVIYRKGSASVKEVQDELEDPSSYSAIRALMRLMEEKGYIKHKRDGAKYIYSPVKSKKTASKEELKRVVKNYFDGSAKETMNVLKSMK